MKMYSKRLICFFFCNLCFAFTLTNGSNKQERKPYIVYMGELPENTISLGDEHHNILLETIGNEVIARESKIHSYGRSFNGFVARLLPHEAKRLSQKENVVSVFPSGIRQLRTTRSWDFLGIPLNVTRNPELESNTIVALLDTGVYVRSPSFNDEGFGPPPPKWKGKCAKGVNFTGCNNKVIGAQYFNLEGAAPDDQLSPADFDGHGTHTSSTAGGTAVPNVSYHGIAKGTARGGAPSARIASYKVCWGIGCSDMDILAGFDAAIADGVDIISASLGGPSMEYFQDPLAIGSFHAMKKGIFVTCAGGNEGPDLFTIENVAPWIMTVAASTTDRKFETIVELGDGRSFSGSSLDIFPMKQMYPLLNGALAANDSSTEPYLNVSACDAGTLSASKVKGNILFCRGGGVQEYTIKDLGGVGTIKSSEDYVDTPFPTEAPSAIVSVSNGDQIDSYINSTKEAKAMIHKTRDTFNVTAPLVASFSSRGPQTISLNILKPDVAAPGVSILAAYSELVSLSGDPNDKRRLKYYIESGTSMATPHVAGAAAYVKSFHPFWSPAAIKSALMTTAKPFEAKVEGAQLAYGSGEINPTRALHPGLIYDINVDSYISFLCKEGYNSTNISLLTGKRENCSKFEPARGIDGLNYPSMHLQINSTDISAVFYRTVTYVGAGKSVFKAKVHSPKSLSVTVSPNTLAFSKPYQKKSFKVTLNGTFAREKSWYLSGSLVWSDHRHSAKSPILIYRAAST